MSERILLCVDLSYQVYRAAAAHPMLTSRRIFTGGLYGFYTTLGKMIRETGATDIFLGQDVKPYKRSELYPEYKQLRKKAADEELLRAFKQSMSLVTETAQELGLPIWGVKGFEFDDLAAHAERKYKHRFDCIYFASNDSDLWQLLDNERIFIYRRSIIDLMDGKRLRKEYGLTPEQYMLATALMGTHNDVAGIPRVGEKTAIDAVLSPPKLRALREKHNDLIERNLKLIKLPHGEFPWEESIPKPNGTFNARSLYRTLGRYDIDVTGAMERSLAQVLR